MMVGMMLPSATPMVLLYARVCRKSLDMAAPDTGAFVMGYVAVWTLFSAAATALQWGLEQAALLSPTMTSASPFFAGMVLVLAGLYQWTPAKQACLSRCRSPVEFLSTHWRPGAGGAFAMGLRHGAFCVGCCWALMALLFVGGVMNLLWRQHGGCAAGPGGSRRDRRGVTERAYLLHCGIDGAGAQF